jgi:hypothetical protein
VFLESATPVIHRFAEAKTAIDPIDRWVVRDPVLPQKDGAHILLTAGEHKELQRNSPISLTLQFHRDFKVEE